MPEIQFKSSKFGAAKRQFLNRDQKLAKLGRDKIDLLEDLSHLEERMRRLSKELMEVRTLIDDARCSITSLSKEIRPLTIEHRYFYKLMSQHEKNRGGSAIAVQRIDENGKVLNEYGSMKKAAKDSGICIGTVRRILEGDPVRTDLMLRYKPQSNHNDKTST